MNEVSEIINQDFKLSKGLFINPKLLRKRFINNINKGTKHEPRNIAILLFSEEKDFAFRRNTLLRLLKKLVNLS